jgi:hypothetical protein
MADIIFEEITPYVEGSGDNGKTAREKINRNFDKLKGFDDAVANIAELQGRDEPIVFTESKAYNSFIKTFFVDYNNAGYVDLWIVATQSQIKIYDENTENQSSLVTAIVLDGSRSVYCAGTTEGVYYYFEIDWAVYSAQSLPLPITKLTSWAMTPSFDPRVKDGGFTESPILNKYIKKLWVEIKDDFTGNVGEIINKLTVYTLKSTYSSGVWTNQFFLRQQVGSEPAFQYTSISEESEVSFTTLLSPYKDKVIIHAVIDWVGLRSANQSNNTRTYLTPMAYDKTFWKTLMSDDIGDDSKVAFSQKGAKALSERIDYLQEGLTEELIYTGNDLEDGYYVTNIEGTDLSNATIRQNSNYPYYHIIVPVKVGDRITIRTRGGSNARAWALTDNDRVILAVSNSNSTLENYLLDDEITQDGYLYVHHGGASASTTDADEFKSNFSLSILRSTLSSNSAELEDLAEEVAALQTNAVSVSKICNPKLNFQKSQLRVLDIGNSFTSNPTTYLGNFVSAAGIDVSNMCLYTAIMSGASFKEWYNVYYDTASYSGETKKTYSIARLLGGITQSLGSSSGSYDSDDGTRLRGALTSCQWDLILIHQVSGYSTLSFSNLEGDGDGGYLRKFIRLLRTLQPSATIGFLFTHVSNRNAAAIAGTTLRNTGERFTEMAKTTKSVCSAYGIDFVIPVGAAIENLRVSSLNETDYNFSNDNHHLADGLGKYVAAAAYFEALFAPRYGKSVYGSTYLVAPTKPEQGTTYYKEYVDVTQENAPTAQMCAVLAVNDIWNINNPDNVTPPQVPSRLPFVPSVIMPVVSKSTSSLSSPLAVELGKYNKCSISSISTYPIVLPSMSDTSAIYELYIYIEVAAGKSVQITSADNKNILFGEGFFSLNTAFETAATYEIKAIFNGAKWLLTAIKYS